MRCYRTGNIKQIELLYAYAYVYRGGLRSWVFSFFCFSFFLRFRLLLLLLLAALEYANMATAPLLSSPASSVNFCRRRGRFSF